MLIKAMTGSQKIAGKMSIAGYQLHGVQAKLTTANNATHHATKGDYMNKINKHYSELITAKAEKKHITRGQQALREACRRYNRADRQLTKIQLRGER